MEGISLIKSVAHNEEHKIQRVIFTESEGVCVRDLSPAAGGENQLSDDRDSAQFQQVREANKKARSSPADGSKKPLLLD